MAVHKFFMFGLAEIRTRTNIENVKKRERVWRKVQSAPTMFELDTWYFSSYLPTFFGISYGRTLYAIQSRDSLEHVIISRIIAIIRAENLEIKSMNRFYFHFVR